MQAGALAEFRADWSTAVKTYQTAYSQVQKVPLGTSLPLQHWYELTSVAEQMHIKVGSCQCPHTPGQHGFTITPAELSCSARILLSTTLGCIQMPSKSRCRPWCATMSMRQHFAQSWALHGVYDLGCCAVLHGAVPALCCQNVGSAHATDMVTGASALLVGQNRCISFWACINSKKKCSPERDSKTVDGSNANITARPLSLNMLVLPCNTKRRHHCNEHRDHPRRSERDTRR